jgi:hypothetical protein
MAVTVFSADANAVVCARGVYRAGCVGPGGAAVVQRPVAGLRLGQRQARLPVKSTASTGRHEAHTRLDSFHH